MSKFRSCLLVFAFLGLSLTARGQALPAATRGGQIQVGAGWAYGPTDYYFKNVTGFTIFADMDLTEHLGAEADVHSMSIITPDDFIERSYLIGPRYRFSYGRFTPYGKVLFGLGTTSNDNPNWHTEHTPETHFAYSLGAGVDYAVKPRWNLRVDYEHQTWPGFGAHGLSPVVLTVGVAYHIR